MYPKYIQLIGNPEKLWESFGYGGFFPSLLSITECCIYGNVCASMCMSLLNA